MDDVLYPIKFKPQFKEKIWGGDKLETVLNKNTGNKKHIGESWELSAVQGNISEVANGFLQGNNLQELIEIYMGDLIGEHVYEHYGLEFPLLIKFIDASDDLSIQVHPGDALAKQRHQAYGKTEMWYVLDADEGSQLITGFNQKTDKAEYLQYLNNDQLLDILNKERVAAGDAFYIPAGRVHAIGKGILLAEIQQTSDITYRIYDYNRKDADGNTRELHTDLAVDAIDYNYYDNYRLSFAAQPNKTSKLISCDYFTTNILNFNTEITKDFAALDSFVIYMAVEGAFSIQYNNGEKVQVEKGETVLIPNLINQITLIPKEPSKLLEVFISGKNITKDG